jgi:hypothetical protein
MIYKHNIYKYMSNKILYKLLFTLLTVFLTLTATRANNLKVDSVKIISRNDAQRYCIVQLNVSWENSFRTNIGSYDNWDAAWVFLKFKKAKDFYGGYKHCTLGDSSTHVIPAGFTYSAPADKKGIFIYRDSPGNGNVTINQIQLRWDYGVDGMDVTNNVDIKAFGVEMVWVPQGEYYLGSGGTESNSFTKAPWSSGATTPYKVSSEDTIPLGNTAGQLYSTGLAVTGTTLPAVFPKGYKGFYCMKYELSQQAYADFLNTLTRPQQKYMNNYNLNYWGSQNPYLTHINGYSWYRNNLRTVFGGNNASIQDTLTPAVFIVDGNNNGVGGDAADGKEIAMTMMHTKQLCGYLDWACLRPMTELEYTKAARGVAYPVANEFAWGGTTPNSITGVTNGYYANETYATAGQNISTGTTYGQPTRGGFAANATSTRISSGASYWGIMELSGNADEMCIGIQNAQGRAFNGLLGNGLLEDGVPSNWDLNCAFIGRGGSNTAGEGSCVIEYRYWNQTSSPSQTALNLYPAYNNFNRMNTSAGIRGIR